MDSEEGGVGILGIRKIVCEGQASWQVGHNALEEGAGLEGDLNLHPYMKIDMPIAALRMFADMAVTYKDWGGPIRVTIEPVKLAKESWVRRILRGRRW
jgi:hypothetical protein